MSSVNAHYTFHYSQPEDYKFSHDSVFFARAVHEIRLARPRSASRILDICAGCGIVGLDYIFHESRSGRGIPQVADFLEIQEPYLPHFLRNRDHVEGLGEKAQFHVANYSVLLGPEWAGRYDLILCNPPYFRVSQGARSPSEFKNRCRFYIDSDFKTLLLGIVNSLEDDGEGYLLLRDLSDHGVDLEAEARSVLGARAVLERIGDIRGTGLARLSRT